MAEAAKRVAATTTLTLGDVRIPIGLFSTSAKSASPVKFDTAGPNGGRLHYEQRGRPAVEDGGAPGEEAKRDALADDPGPERPIEDRAEAPAQRAGLLEPTQEGIYAQVLVEDGSGEVVPSDAVRRGVRLEDGSFVDLSARIEAIEEQTRLEAMDVIAFVDVAHVPREYVTGSYYVGVDAEEDARALALLYRAMRATRRGAVVKWTKRSRQAFGVIVPHGRSGTLIALELMWAEDIRQPPKRALRVRETHETLPPQAVEAAIELVQAMSAPPSVLDEQRDDALALREELLARALAGEIESDSAPEPPQPMVGVAEAFANAAAALADAS